MDRLRDAVFRHLIAVNVAIKYKFYPVAAPFERDCQSDWKKRADWARYIESKISR